MNSSSVDDARAVKRAAMRKAILHLVLAVVVLDAVALGIYYLGGIADGSTQTQKVFTWVWLVATAFTVAFLLRRVRKIRYDR